MNDIFIPANKKLIINPEEVHAAMARYQHLFAKYQRFLVPFANSKLGRWYLGRNTGWKSDGQITRLFPHAVEAFMGYDHGQNHFESKFFCGSVFAFKNKELLMALESLEIASDFAESIRRFAAPELVLAHFMGMERVAALPMVMLTTSNFNPTADAGDGLIISNHNTWSTARNSSVNGGTDQADIRSSSRHRSSGFTYEIKRGFTPFNTSSIPDADNIDNYSLRMYNASKSNGLSNGAVHICRASQANASSLATGDYTSVATYSYTSLGSLSYASITTSANNTFSNLSDGANVVSKTSNTFLANLEYHDQSNTTPPSLNTANDFGWQDTGGANPPQLTVNHSAGGAPYELMMTRVGR